MKKCSYLVDRSPSLRPPQPSPIPSPSSKPLHGLHNFDTLAVALSSGPIHLYDITHRQLIRRFRNPDTQPCVDMALSSDGCWLVSAHRGEPLIKTWDIIQGRLVDCFRVSTPITSLAISPAGEFLATTHANCLGVYLWDNCGTYKRLHLQLLPDDYVPPVDKKPVAMPTRYDDEAYCALTDRLIWYYKHYHHSLLPLFCPTARF
ncbi:unnamed protein product [Echinostoma caproni]|uniref:WD_REPEATS_REGION domain-containing protein n=1 Tax=Echinostoma caproni TaxID=27848 RepID=A0A3P8L844_9TREM|nr:unnamed protein product [Echinostoma caproni]